MDQEIKPKKLARIDYWHGAVLSVDGVRVVDDLDEKFGDPNTGEINFEAEFAYFHELGVTHVIDDELDYSGEFDKPMGYEWPIDEYTAAVKQVNAW